MRLKGNRKTHTIQINSLFVVLYPNNFTQLKLVGEIRFKAVMVVCRAKMYLDM